MFFVLLLGDVPCSIKPILNHDSAGRVRYALLVPKGGSSRRVGVFTWPSEEGKIHWNLIPTKAIYFGWSNIFHHSFKKKTQIGWRHLQKKLSELNHQVPTFLVERVSLEVSWTFISSFFQFFHRNGAKKPNEISSKSWPLVSASSESLGLCAWQSWSHRYDIHVLYTLPENNMVWGRVYQYTCIYIHVFTETYIYIWYLQ